MNTTSNPTAASSNAKRIILASAYRHERHSSGRQERALKSLRKMGRFDDNDARDQYRLRRFSPADETVDE
jgi:hypothetical protein